MSERFMGIDRPHLTDAGCWVVVRRYVGSLYAQGSNCGCKPRPGFLTCRHHAEYEQAAQASKVARERKAANATTEDRYA